MIFEIKSSLTIYLGKSEKDLCLCIKRRNNYLLLLSYDWKQKLGQGSIGISIYYCYTANEIGVRMIPGIQLKFPNLMELTKTEEIHNLSQGLYLGLDKINTLPVIYQYDGQGFHRVYNISDKGTFMINATIYYPEYIYLDKLYKIGVDEI